MTDRRVDSTLTKGLSILEALAQERGGLGVSALSRRLDLTKSNTFRLLQSLSVLGYVEQSPDKLYRATLKTWQVGRTVVENLNLRALAAPMLQFLSHETGEAVYLAVRQHLQIVYIDKIDSQKPIRSWNPVGGTAPLHTVSTGKAILAADYANLRPLLQPPLPRFTTQTLTDLEDLDRDMAQTRARGFSVDRGEFRDRVYSIGAAIVLPDGQPIGAIGISVPDVNLPEEGVDRYGSLVLHAAQDVSEKVARA